MIINYDGRLDKDDDDDDEDFDDRFSSSDDGLDAQ